jgi:predicted nuclease with TOPRIM domain
VDSKTLPETILLEQDDLKVISVMEYTSLLDQLEWYEGEEKRLRERLEELESDAYAYEQRYNSLEG